MCPTISNRSELLERTSGLGAKPRQHGAIGVKWRPVSPHCAPDLWTGRAWFNGRMVRPVIGSGTLERALLYRMRPLLRPAPAPAPSDPRVRIGELSLFDIRGAPIGLTPMSCDRFFAAQSTGTDRPENRFFPIAWRS